MTSCIYYLDFSVIHLIIVSGNLILKEKLLLTASLQILEIQHFIQALSSTESEGWHLFSLYYLPGVVCFV